MSTRRAKSFGLLAALLAIVLLAAACAGDDEEAVTEAPAPAPTPPAETEAPATDEAPETDDAPPPPPPAEPSGPLRVAIVAPSASNDLAFTQSIVDGVAALGETRELEVEVTDGTFIVEDAAVAIREYAESGFDLVIAHGSQYGGSLQEIAQDFPDTSFAWGTSNDTFGLANVFAYTAASDQGGYVLGSMAAALTETGVIGVVGPIEVGDAKLFVDGFVSGAGAQDASVDVNVVYTESFSDVAKAAETAEAHVSQGADVMTGTAQMVVGAVGVAQREGAAWFATQADQTELAPEIVVASQVYEWEVILSEIAAAIDRGVKGGESFTLTLANGGLNIAFNDAYGLSADIRAIGEDTVAGIIDGSINTMGEAAPAPSGPLRVAIVAPSASNDLAFTQSIVDGVAALGETRELEVEVTDGTFIVEDAAVAIREYAESGFDLVIAHGSQYGGSLQEIAQDFPDTSFAWGTSNDTFGLANVFAYTAASDQGGYVLGSMAAALTETGVIGVVGPIEVGDAKLFVDGFVSGAGAQDASVDVNVVYTESFSDVAKAAETAEAHVSQGADVMTGTAQMVVGAVGVAQREGAAWFATQADQTELAPEIVVASQVYEWEVILSEIAAAIDRGVKGGESFTLTLANGGLNIAFNDAYGLSADIRAIGEATVAGIIDGSINTGS
ncbi:MAG: BMP family protein [bacterium]|nr:BMP family protein [bacterium]